MFELIYRDGYAEETLFEADELEEIARLTAEKSGEEPDELFRLFDGEDDHADR